ncbi:hypothetical protein EIN_099510 [Entamoeba invadens IP1]|uniref:Leucine rich repeat containing protein BspA family protein n=1 Tax=Entamoeba invadens IP1 TaxID=370355 RepID=L7FNH4_ENTIV|nr:hypothetical protein EIN_099510 [Entamoeba invadens IP1]ELP93760.1 hypothetical protein EIN_099510 [Entamoeba invadens IP1]|eukprot:XP_004260531.1 hypothetical protein EIN_099510 [Entamoeba invadens IP1]
MSQIDSYNMMIVSQFLKSLNDFIHIEFVCKKYKDNLSKFHYNPIPITRKTQKYFPNLETLHLYSKYSSKLSFKKLYSVVVHFNVKFDDIQKLHIKNCPVENVLYKNIEITRKYIKSQQLPPEAFFNVSHDIYYINLTNFVVPQKVLSVNRFSFSYCAMNSIQ